MKSFINRLFANKSSARKPKDRRRALALETLTDRTLMAASVTASLNTADGILRIEGTYGSDQIHMRQSLIVTHIDGVRIAVTNGGVTTSVAGIRNSQISKVIVAGLDGDDHVEFHSSENLRAKLIPLVIHGGMGNDTLIGGDANDTIDGGSGVDSILGGDGKDSLYGDANPAAAQIVRDYNLHIQPALEVINGNTIKWLTPKFDPNGNNAWYYITPTGNLFHYSNWGNGSEQIIELYDESFVQAYDPSYFEDPRKLEVERGLYEMGLYPNWGHQDERWLEGVGDLYTNRWYYITPAGELYRWDGLMEAGPSPSTGQLLATLDFSYHADPRELVAAAVDDGSDDVINGQDGADTIVGGGGNDIMYGGDEPDSLVGGEGVDVITGGNGNDSITGGEGNDVIEGENGADVIRGDGGDDHLLGGFLNTLTFESGSYQSTVKNESGSYRNDTIYGGDGSDTLLGNTGSDRLIGENDNDLILGENGFDVLIGAFDGWAGEAGNDGDTLRGGSENDTLYGGDGNDSLLGESGNDVLYGENGFDTLEGAAGRDILHGGADRNTLTGGDGNDSLYGGDSDDLMFGQRGNDFLWADGGADVLWGGEWDDSTLYFTGDRDTLHGLAGDDWLFGGGDADELHGGIGIDSLRGSFGGDKIYGNEDNDDMWGGPDNDTMGGGRGNDSLWGEEGNDQLFGDEDDDQLDGGDLRDTLNGGTGRDSMSGGKDWDTFREPVSLNSPFFGQDITDVNQDASPTCATLAVIAAARSVVHHLGNPTTTGGHDFRNQITVLGNNLYRVRLYPGGRAKDFTVFFDGTWTDNDPSISGDGDYWVTILHRARMQHYGVGWNNYMNDISWDIANDKSGGRLFYAGDALQMFTGKKVYEQVMTKMTWQNIENGFRLGAIMVAGTPTLPNEAPLLGEHVYAIVDAHVEAFTGRRMVTVYNPHGKYQTLSWEDFRANTDYLYWT